jgi:hypothetical protein
MEAITKQYIKDLFFPPVEKGPVWFIESAKDTFISSDTSQASTCKKIGLVVHVIFKGLAEAALKLSCACLGLGYLFVFLAGAGIASFGFGIGYVVTNAVSKVFCCCKIPALGSDEFGKLLEVFVYLLPERPQLPEDGSSSDSSSSASNGTRSPAAQD